jgi:hypothetical protein
MTKNIRFLSTTQLVVNVLFLEQEKKGTNYNDKAEQVL